MLTRPLVVIVGLKLPESNCLCNLNSIHSVPIEMQYVGTYYTTLCKSGVYSF